MTTGTETEARGDMSTLLGAGTNLSTIEYTGKRGNRTTYVVRNSCMCVVVESASIEGETPES